MTPISDLHQHCVRARCTLIVFIDDATRRLTSLRFVPAETTRAYLETLRAHMLAHGVPLAFYSDRHGIFRVNAKDAESGDGKTEFGRVSERPGIEPIHALTPQAKGRGERATRLRRTAPGPTRRKRWTISWRGARSGSCRRLLRSVRPARNIV